MLGIPVGSGSGLAGDAGAMNFSLGGGGSGSNNAKKEIVPFAKFVVYTIFPETDDNAMVDDILRPPKTRTLEHLRALLQATESFFHPSNTGRWSVKLSVLVLTLATQFVSRWNKEQLPDCKTPSQCRLTPAIKREFVDIMKGVTFLSMFGKEATVMTFSNIALKHLAKLEPSIIIPSLVEKVYPALENLTQTHRTLSCLLNLGLTSFSFLDHDAYPLGATHLLPLLNLSLPGIDMNDPVKTNSTLQFVSIVLMTVPLIDLTELPRDEKTMDVDDEYEEVSSLVRNSTADFESWVLQFVDRCLSV
ncbi:hypothetical protein HDU76_004766, partial [Blyttiomyces sp. JEL0837]